MKYLKNKEEKNKKTKENKSKKKLEKINKKRNKKTSKKTSKNNIANDQEFQKVSESKRKRKETIEKFQGKKKEHKLRKFILYIFLIVATILGITTGISIFRWKTMAKEMTLNENSIVKDIDGNVIAKIGCEHTTQTR